MIEENNHSVRYLDKRDIETLHRTLAEWAVDTNDPIPPFTLVREGDIEALVAAPQHRFFGTEAYPTLEEKAAIIFYTVNKRQIFLNGNKRMSTLCLLVFLGINGKGLSVSSDELTKKALWLANTASLEFPQIKQELVAWIRGHLVDVPAGTQ
ncbi:MAG TPA: type II toxin-antitoxin system death-on-curing family toxin [Bryobacteraceae bacterium]|nr:type II toxin-antitoxin system death-on-curing family toxin [Bryobacteraceae bacterium]